MIKYYPAANKLNLKKSSKDLYILLSKTPNNYLSLIKQNEIEILKWMMTYYDLDWNGDDKFDITNAIKTAVESGQIDILKLIKENNDNQFLEDINISDLSVSQSKNTKKINYNKTPNHLPTANDRVLDERSSSTPTEFSHEDLPSANHYNILMKLPNI